jgi:outer membrane lipoprotein-sorting protein
MKSLSLILLASLLVISPWANSLSGDELLLKVDKNMQPESYEMYRKLINIEPDGSKKEFVLYSVKKGRDNVAALFLDPPSERGRVTLRQGENMWLYIPNVGKPLRITSMQSVVGGVFNNSDILRAEYASEYKAESLQTMDNHYVLTLRASLPSTAYDKLVMQIDKKHMVPLQIEAYAASGLLIKTLRYSEIRDFGDGITRPAVVETDSPLYKGYKSVMLFSRIKRRNLSDEVFTLNYMSRLDELR